MDAPAGRPALEPGDVAGVADGHDDGGDSPTWSPPSSSPREPNRFSYPAAGDCQPRGRRGQSVIVIQVNASAPSP